MVLKILEEREPAKPAVAGGAAGYAVAIIGAMSLLNQFCPDSLEADLAAKFSSVTQPFLGQSVNQSRVRLRTGPIEDCEETSSMQNEPCTELPPLQPSTSAE